MRIPGAVIFDMDGVLIDSEPIHREIEKKLFDELGVIVPEEVHLSYMGASGEFMYSDLKSRFELPELVGELMEKDDRFRCDYFKHLEGIQLNDGVLPLLEEIKSAGLKLAVATSSSPEMVSILLNRCEISSFFDAIVTTIEAGASKPSPDVYLLAAQKIGIAPASCIVFEDSPNGISAAKSAGMFCIAIQPDCAFDLSKADGLIKTFSGFILDQLLEMFNSKHVTEE
jgi:beta-phosphoglucomutase